MDLWCKILLLTVHLFSLCINLLATILILKYIKHKQAGHQTLMDRVKTHYLITLSTHGAIFCLLPIGLISHEYMDYVVIQSISLLLSYSLLLLLFNILLFVVVRWVPNFPVKSKCFYCKKKIWRTSISCYDGSWRGKVRNVEPSPIQINFNKQLFRTIIFEFFLQAPLYFSSLGQLSLWKFDFCMYPLMYLAHQSGIYSHGICISKKTKLDAEICNRTK